MECIAMLIVHLLVFTRNSIRIDTFLMCVCLNYMVFSVSAATVFKEPVCILQRSFPIFCEGKFDLHGFFSNSSRIELYYLYNRSITYINQVVNPL